TRCSTPLSAAYPAVQLLVQQGMRCFVHKCCAHMCLSGIMLVTEPDRNRPPATTRYLSCGFFGHLDARRRATRQHAGGGGKGERERGGGGDSSTCAGHRAQRSSSFERMCC